VDFLPEGKLFLEKLLTIRRNTPVLSENERDRILLNIVERKISSFLCPDYLNGNDYPGFC
jgi:hypothetical protein